MSFQPGAVLNTQAMGNRPENVEVPHIDTRAPTSADGANGIYPLGKRWVDKVGNSEYILTSLSSSTGSLLATWTPTGGASLAIATINNNAPVAGNYTLAGTASQITVTETAGTSTFSIPTPFIAPGSIASTTTMTAGTGLTATTGNVTATAGNFVSSASGNGLLFNSPTATGAAASPLVLNGRSGAAVFSSVSIAAAADLTLTITNSAVTASTTQVIYSLSGVTTGAALSIKSVTNSAGSSAVVVTNGTGATTSTSNITLTFLVLN